MMDKNCKLCVSRKADKSNSHIIPKFMGKGLYEDIQPKHAIIVNKLGKVRKEQDTPKEDNLLCAQCEKRLEKIETYFAGVFRDLGNIQSSKRKYKLDNLFGQDYLICEELNPSLYKLFVYSIIWRLSVCEIYEFGAFKLSKEIEEELRLFLDANLTDTHKELMEINLEFYPLYHNILIKPKSKIRGYFMAFQSSNFTFSIFTVDYAILFYVNERELVKGLEHFSNNNENPVKIILGNDKTWMEWNNLVFAQMLKN
ncbi:hypothetical protein ACFPVY_12965 [Flavobacterium qiangtangense]|uniref:HNH endonuclease n=1 Tax=Flavobacterium qiangtangense TaxID=1442595 RepID=A0ABW1PQ91_9FLAO